jgi:hypothetical protein
MPLSKDTSSPSTESSTGGNSSEQAATQTDEVENPLTQGGDVLALVPAERERSASEAGSEAIPQYIIDNLLGMHITISHSAIDFF